MDIKAILQRIQKQQVIQETIVKRICKNIQQIFLTQANVQPISSPVNIVGDIHGQFYDVRKLFSIGTFMINLDGYPPQTKYIFIGDFVDRGFNSLQTIMLLFCLKILYPNQIYLLRGNHQSRNISISYGFHDQISKKYGSSNVWKYFNQAFDYLPISAVVDNTIFCVHGGLSPQIHAIDQIREIDRVKQIPTQGSFADLMWSDPEQIDIWAANPRGVGYIFGQIISKQFNQHNGVSLIARAHQLVEQGYREMFDENLVTIWSAPNYCYRCGNIASFLKISEGGKKQYVTFKEDDRSKNSVNPRELIPYFL